VINVQPATVCVGLEHLATNLLRLLNLLTLAPKYQKFSGKFFILRQKISFNGEKYESL